LRHRPGVVGTKTLMVLGSWRRGEARNPSKSMKSDSH
jgi:hypothetical protein